MRHIAAIEYDVDHNGERTVMVRLDGVAGPSFEIYVTVEPQEVRAKVHTLAKGQYNALSGKPYLAHTETKATPLATAQSLANELRDIISQEYAMQVSEVYGAKPTQEQAKASIVRLKNEESNCYQHIMADLVDILTDIPNAKWTGDKRVTSSLLKRAQLTEGVEVVTANYPPFHTLQPGVRKAAKALLAEFEAAPKNQLVDAFLRESKVWSHVAQHLNSQSRQAILQELGLKADHRGGPTDARAESEMDLGGSV
jgi:hypothetical protein